MIDINRHIYRKAWLCAVLSAFLCVCHFQAEAQADTVQTLTGVEVEYKVSPQGVGVDAGGTYTVTSRGLRRGIRALGEADALTALRMLPGVEGGSDYSSGVSVNGSDYSHNTYTLDGVRVFFPYHFGGIFSTFNSGHVARLAIDGVRRGVASPFGLGGDVMAYTPDGTADEVSGIANVGMVSSSVTIAAPASGTTSVVTSVRASYIDRLYGHLMRDDDADTHYSFEDYNLTVLQSCGRNGLLKAAGFYNSDRLRFDDGSYALNSSLRWHNAVAGLSYTHSGDDVSIDSRLSVSAYGSHLDMMMSQFSMAMPASVCQWAATGSVDLRRHSATLGYRAEYTRYTPQTATTDGIISASPATADYRSCIVSIGGSKDWQLERVVISGNGRLLWYGCGSYRRLGFDAIASALYAVQQHTLRLDIGTHTQYMHHVGLSDIGLASNFYLPATAALPLQRSYGVDVNYGYTCQDGQWSVTAKAFWHRLLHTPEYDGDILGLLTDGYDPVRSVTESDGYNTGGDVLARYTCGAVSAWGGYSLAVCRRQFAGMGGRWVPSATEPLHSLKLFGQWSVSRRVSLLAYFVMSSGRRYTPVEAVFIVGGNVLADYGPRNSAHLPLYHRLDLSVTLYMPPIRVGARNIVSYLNLSVLNAYGHPNIEMQYFTYNDQNHTIRLRRVQSLYRFMPSLSYTVEF